jgi:outer membrane protein assembly factor BamB
LWERPYQVKYEQNAITPTIHKDLVVCSGWQKETECVRISQAGGKVVAIPVWSNSQISFFMSSPVVHGDHLYGFAQRQKGSLVCLALGDGKVRWSSPGRMGECVSIVRVGDRLLVQTTEGELLVVAADPEAYRELHRVRVAETPVWAHTAVTTDRLYVKDRNHLTAFAWRG